MVLTCFPPSERIVMASSVQSVVYLFSQPLVIQKTDTNDGCKRIIQEVETVLDCTTEREIIKDAIKEGKSRSIRFRSCCATIGNVDKLFKSEATVVHFAGHGSENQKLGITFESNKGEAIVPTIDDLRKFLPVSGEPGRIKILFVSSCYSESSGAAFEESKAARHIIAVNRNERISDKLSEGFTQSFYQALFSGYTVQKAFDNAKMAITIDDPASTSSSGRNSTAASMFVLLPRGHVCTHECCYFPRQLHGPVTIDIVPPVTRYYCKKATLPEKLFVGRYFPMQRIYSYLVDTHCAITVTGV